MRASLNLEEQRRPIAAREQAHRAERPDAADSDGLEGRVPEHVAVEQAQPFRREPLAVGREHLLRVDALAWIGLAVEVIDGGALVGDLVALDEVREVVVALRRLAGLGDDRLQAAPQRGILDVPDLAFELDPAVPDLQRRQPGEDAHAQAIGLDGRRRGGARALRTKLGVERRDRDARGEALQVHGEVDARQRLVEIVDVEEDVFLRRREGTEVHEVAVAAGLDVDAGKRRMGEVLRHHGRSAAQEGERAHQHALVALGDELGHADAVAFGEQRDGIAAGVVVELGMRFARRFAPQHDALLIARAKSRGSRTFHDGPPGKRPRPAMDRNDCVQNCAPS